MSDIPVIMRPAIAGLAVPGRGGRAEGAAGVTLREITGVAAASLIARKGKAPDLAAAARRAFGLDPPETPRCAAAAGLTFLWAGPDQWMVRADGGDSDALAARLSQTFDGLASAAAQGDGRAALRVSGPRARDALAKGLPIDLHETVFKPGDVALSVVHHIGVHLWQVDDAPTYDIALFRSFAGSFWRWITVSSAEFGYDVLPAGPAD